MLDGLSAFDSPTGFAAGVNSVSARLNDRKEFLVDLGVLNKVGLRQDGIEVTDDGHLRVAGRDLPAVNAALHDRGLGDLTLVPTAAFRRKVGAEYPRLSNTDLKLINPAPVPRLLGDKGLQYWELYSTPLPVPPWQPLDHYAGVDPETAVGDLRDDFRSDAALVLKARDSTQGAGVWFYPGGVDAFGADWVDGTAPDPFLEDPDRFLLQYAVPHEYDKRVVAAGDTPVAGEDRYGSPDTDKSNLNLVDTDASTLRGAAAELLEMGAVEPLAPDRLDPAVERAVTDLYDALLDLTDLPADRFHTWVGWDFLVVDPADDRLETLPEAVVEGLLDDRYRTRDGQYLVFGEGNLSPGSKERYVNALVHGREGLCWDSAANLFGYGASISRDEPFEPGVPDPIDTETLATRYEI